MWKKVMIIVTLFCAWLFYIHDSRLRVDKELKLSHDNLKETMKQYYANKQLSAIDQLKATPLYPTPYVLAQFANMTYSDCEHGDPKHPDAWQFLTTAINRRNGYFGTAYWHAEHQQVVIAHRGTDINNLIEFFKDFSSDIIGVLCNIHVDQINSASTFAHNVATVLQEIEQEKKVSFEVFFTGHSLGGWLAQITTFTIEYLEVKEGTFLKKQKTEQDEPLASSTVQDSHDVTYSYHPHTVVFDSPGCEQMLLQLKETFDIRLHGSSIDLQHLDITSYLSAPNRINTCNSHLGTVYRIFTDLSDMNWMEKFTALYNLATHSMANIVQIFDSETGQVFKDDKGEPKIRQVGDWPVSAGLKGEAEWINFFKWAEHLNNFDPQVMDNELPQGHDPPRYLTMKCDESNVSLSIFTQDERKFLEHYCSLRDVPDFFQLQDLFSELNDTEAGKEAEQMLRDFKVEDKIIHCPNASTLHALIPYVKRLVRLFPKLKDKAKDQSSPTQKIKRFYQHETQRYVKKIRQNVLEFNPGALVLREFLTSDQQIWQIRMVDGDVWTGIAKVYRVLQNTSCTPNFSSDGDYTILDLERLLTDNKKLNLTALLASMETPHLLMIACGTKQTVNNEVKSMLQEFFNILKQKKNIKIILTAQLEGETADSLEQIAKEILGEGFTTTNETVKWSDLTANSKTTILKKTVIFQGTGVALNQLISPEQMTDSFPLADLLHEKELTIGEESVPSASSGYNEKYYIDRTFNHNIVIKQDNLDDEEKKELEDLLASTEQEFKISNDKTAGKFVDLFASTEEEFKQLCQQNPESNVHWLVGDKSGQQVWQQSQGNLTSLRKYIDDQKTHSYAPKDLDKLLEQAKQQRVMLIADKAGMGKTTVLTHLSNRIKQKFPAHWLVRINLKDYTKLLKAQKGKKMDKGWVLEFVSKEVLKLESQLEKELFKNNFEGNEISKIVVMVDGFDEICTDDKETAIHLIQVLKETSIEQLWVTTRTHLREELEDKLQQLSYTLQPFSKIEQVEFLKKFWPENLHLGVTNQYRLELYATALIGNLTQSISDKDNEFTSVPLQTRMLAEVFEEEFISFYMSQENQPQLQHKINLLELYAKFNERKFEIYFNKSTAQDGDAVIEGLRKYVLEQLQEGHELLALEALFTKDQVAFLQRYNNSAFKDEELSRIGIAHRNSEGKPQFIHQTFAEYFVARFLIKQLTKETKQYKEVQDIILNEVLLISDYHVIRAFLNGLLETSPPSKEALDDYGEKLEKQWNKSELNWFLSDGIPPLHLAAREDKAGIIEFLLHSLKSRKNSDAKKNLLLATDEWGETALHAAAEWKSVDALKQIKKWADESHLNTNELKNKLLLATTKSGYTAWHGAASIGSLEALEILWNWAKDLEILPDELLLAQSEGGHTALHLAAYGNHVGILQKLWVWTEEGQLSSNELKKNLFLAKYNNGATAWQIAARFGSLEALEILWNWAKDLEILPDELLLAQSEGGHTALHLAAHGNHVGILQKLWIWTEEGQINSKELKKSLLLVKNHKGYTAWHRAARLGRSEALEILWNWAKGANLNPDELLLAQGGEGETALHLAAYGNHVRILQKLWVWTEEGQLNSKELKKNLLLVKNNKGYTAWQVAARLGRSEALEILWNWAKEVEINLEEFLLAQVGRRAMELELNAD